MVLIGIGIVVGIGLIWVGLRQEEARVAAQAAPMDIEWVADGDFAYASIGEGRILKLTVDGDVVNTEVLADGLDYPRGIAVDGDTLYVAELGTLPCENPLPRCKGEQVGLPTVAEGEREILEGSNGSILAFPITADGLGEPRTVVAGLHFVNADHGLNDLDLGPDGMLYLAVGNLDRLAWDDDGNPPTGPVTDLIGSILRIDPATGEVTQWAKGIRNIFALDRDEEGELWGVDNDGPGRGPWRFEELLHLQEGLDYGFPDDGTVGPYTRRTGFATWIMPVGAGSSGLLVRDGYVISGGCGSVTRVKLTTDTGDAIVREAKYSGCLTTIEPMPDGRLLLGTVVGPIPFQVMTEDDLVGAR